jgi:hypothetical protein
MRIVVKTKMAKTAIGKALRLDPGAWALREKERGLPGGANLPLLREAVAMPGIEPGGYQSWPIGGFTSDPPSL